MRSIAICDDDPKDLDTLRQMTLEYLAQRGLDLTVESHSDSAAFLTALTTSPERYVLLLIDVMLGDENGVCLAKLLRKQSIRSRLIFISTSPDFEIVKQNCNAYTDIFNNN